MTDEKMIEEMAKIVGWRCNEKSMDYCDTVDDCDKCIAIDLYNAGYRKIPKNAVVLTKEEQDKILQATEKRIEQLKKELAQTRKETVRGLLKALKAKQVICSPEEDNFVYMLDINELAKQHGVEVEE